MTLTSRPLPRGYKTSFRWGLAACTFLLAAAVTGALVVLGAFSGSAPLWIALLAPAPFAVCGLGIIAGFLFGVEAQIADKRRHE